MRNPSLLICSIVCVIFTSACTDNPITFSCNSDDQYCAIEDGKKVCAICVDTVNGQMLKKMNANMVLPIKIIII